MNRETEAKLIEFCFTQHSHFAAKAWLQLEYSDREELALVAQFLSNLSWYGNWQELMQIAQQLSPGIAERLPGLIRDKNFDCSRFSSTLKKRIGGRIGCVMKTPSKFFPELKNALIEIIDAIDSSLRSGGYSGEPVRMYLAEGLAVNFYCGTRYTADVDAYFSRRLLLPKEGLEANYKRDDGEVGLLYFDRQYNPALGLAHPAVEKDALELSEINEQGRLINLYVLSPVDLAVSKLEMLSEDDYSDILTLAEQGYFTAEQLSARCREALVMYAGNDAEILKTLEGLTRKIEELNPEDDQGFEMAP